MYKRSEKFINHLFLHCEVARELCSAIFSLFRVKWAMPKRVIELLDCCCCCCFFFFFFFYFFLVSNKLVLLEV
jgi:hypothetical protein